MNSVAVIGAKGFVGTQICQCINKQKNLKLIPVIRGDDIEDAISKSDVVVHAANPSKRFYAENNPHDDFLESVKKTKLIKKYSEGKKLILISKVIRKTNFSY